MPKGLSLYLDGIRFVAALTVMVGHVGTQLISGGFLWQFVALGTPCVVVFFVLSGFVIAYVTSRPNASARDYTIARSARIVSVALPAVALTLVLDALGQYFDPGLYTAAEHSDKHWTIQALAGLSFLNESWFGHIRLGSNGAYWSMGYEVWYYVAFGVLLFAPAGWRLSGLLLALLIAGPRVAAYFPLWLLGAGCFHACRRIRIGVGAGLALWSGTLAFAAVYLALTGGRQIGATLYLRPASDIWIDYAVATWFLANIVGAWFAAPALERWLTPLAQPIRAAAETTFTLYLVHFPVIMVIRAASPFPAASWQTRALLFGGVAIAVRAMAEISEYRTSAWRDAIARLIAPAPRRI